VANSQGNAGSEKSREHRKFPRLECGGVADLRVLPNGGSESGSLINLSKRGCCFLAHQPLRGVIGSRIEVHMKVRGIDLRVIGVMRHIHARTRAGIEFLDLSDRKLGEIDEVLVELTQTVASARD
jgi:hypothetical protein